MVCPIQKYESYLYVNSFKNWLLFTIKVQLAHFIVKENNLFINLACLSVCLSVCLYPINVKTAEPIEPKFFVGHHVTTGKVYEWSKISNICLHKNSIFISIYKFGLSACLFVCLFVSNKRQNGWTDRAKFFCGTSRDHRKGLWMFCFKMYTKRTCSQLI